MTLAEHIAAKHYAVFFRNSSMILCNCGTSPGASVANWFAHHVAEETEALVRARVATDIEAAIPERSHLDLPYRDGAYAGMVRAARIARGDA